MSLQEGAETAACPLSPSGTLCRARADASGEEPEQFGPQGEVISKTCVDACNITSVQRDRAGHGRGILEGCIFRTTSREPLLEYSLHVTESRE